MRNMSKFIVGIMIVLMISACVADGNPSVSQGTDEIKESEVEMEETPFDATYVEKEGIDVIYLAGGCFWGMEKLMQSIDGAVDVISGYANGRADVDPTYEKVITGDTGYRETVRVEYDPNIVSLDALLFTYFNVIDPTIRNAQGNDRGPQYQTGVYYPDEASGKIVARIASIERGRAERFEVEIEPLARFYTAEEYHQDYLNKNPLGYCHISPEEINMAGEMIIDPGDYPLPTEDEIKEKLTDLQYNVTQNTATEPAFNNEYWDNHEQGIYVDVVTGEPLFSSRDKFESGTGWPSFTQPIDENAVRFIRDNTLGMQRIEVRSRAGNSHLGHVFYNDSSSPNGTRYCINSAALQFLPSAEMEAEGYGYLLDFVE